VAEERGSSEARVSPEMGELIRNLGHDLRNRFGVLKNSIYYLRMQVDNGDSKVRRHLNILERETDTVNGTIMDLMSYAWPKSPVCQDLPLNDVLKRALAQVHIPDGVLQHLAFSSGLPALQGDRVQLQHAFRNIMAWVVGDLSPGESLGVASSVRDGHIEIRIASAGLKLASQSLDDLFDFNGSPSAYRVALPLLISKSLIEGHGSTLDISRKDDAVTVVLVRFPL